MDKMLRNAAHMEGHSQGYALDLSPTFNDFEIMQYIRQPLIPASNEFSILVSVALLEPHEVEIDVFEGSKIEVRVKHPLKRNSEGLLMTRNAVYTYEIPPESCKKALKAQWFADNFLQIKTNSLEVDKKECVDRVSLVIERVDTRFKSAIEVPVLKEFVEDIRNRAQDALHYLSFAVNDSAVLVEKDSLDTVNEQSEKTSMYDSGAIPMGNSPKRQDLYSNTGINWNLDDFGGNSKLVSL